MIRFEKIFKQKTGRDWKSKNKKTKGEGYSYFEPINSPTQNVSIWGAKDQTYKDDGTGKIRFSDAFKLRSLGLYNKHPSQTEISPRTLELPLEGPGSLSIATQTMAGR